MIKASSTATTHHCRSWSPSRGSLTGVVLKPREPRRKILIRARMCTGGAWSDVCLLNISSRGLQLQSASPPPRGSYVEIRRGHLVIIARVAWAKGHRFGVRTQDCLPIEAICSEPGKSEQAKPDAGTGDRRSAPRPAAASHEHSRHVARAMEFACLLIVIGGGASLLYGTVSSALAKPLSAVTAGLEDH